MSSCHDIISLDNDVSLNHDPSQHCIIFNFLNVIVIDGNRDIYIKHNVHVDFRSKGKESSFTFTV